MRQIIVAVSGASGAPYARRLLQVLAKTDAHVHLVISPMGRRILADELRLDRVSVETLLGHPAANVTAYRHRDLGARIASGSFLTDAMVICPCSSHTLAAVAGGLGNTLITRAAMVTLKEGRRLIVVPREMPISQIDIANMLRISQAGGIVCPASPGFYLLPETVDQLVDFVVGRVLDLLGVPHTLRTRWADAAGASTRRPSPADT